jgi:23S rRNA (uracil1939-C5)-methyltransferase
MKKNGKTNRPFDITIEKLVYGGLGFARHQGKVVFVPFSAPGDHVRVRPTEEKKTFIRAEIVQILKPGKVRGAPVCPHFGICGGCHWQHVAYASQVEAKRQILEELFYHRFPATRELPISMHACEQPFNYRSRARVQMRGCGPKAVVGFYRHRSHAVEDIDQCPLLRASLNEALMSLRQFRIKADTDTASQEMDMACSQEEGTWATAHIGPTSTEGITPLLGTRKGEDLILRRQVGDFHYFVTASVFFQANDFMVSELAAAVRDLAKDCGHGSALDLFSGVGLFSLPLARQFEKVVAVENSPASSRLCISNASAAGLGNIQVVCADASAWMDADESSGSGTFDLIVLDPPRIGAGTAVMDNIRRWAPATILYVSCDPQTLCRDIAELTPRHYKIDCIRGLDLFPQTFHFETVVRLKRN